MTPSKYLATFSRVIKGVTGTTRPHYLCWHKLGCRAALLLIRGQVSDRDFRACFRLVLGQLFLVSGLLS